MNHKDTWTATITIPAAPVYAMSPNARTHYLAKARATSEAKQIASLALRGVPPIHGQVELDWEIDLPAGRKRMDWDNALCTLKAYGDSLVEAGIIEDDNPDVVVRIGLKQTNYTKHRNRGGEIRCTITAVESARKG